MLSVSKSKRKNEKKMCYKNFRVARKILKRRKNKLFGVTSRFQFLQSEKTEEISIIQIHSFCFCQWKNYGTSEETNR